MKKIKEVIVVEGKDDTYRIHQAVNADTIETRGSAISEETIRLIQKLAKLRGIIIFTDPDFSGERIRKIVSKRVPNAKHAFIKRNLATPKRKHGSLGVEHASSDVIKESLKSVYTSSDITNSDISQNILIDLNLINGHDAKRNRERLCEILNIGYVNGKQLLHRLLMFNVQYNDLINALDKVNTKG